MDEVKKRELEANKDEVICIVIEVLENSESQYTAQAHLAELLELVRADALFVIDQRILRLRSINSRYFFGTGQAGSIKDLVHEYDADLVVIDTELNPIQQRNLEALFKCAVIDRRAIILDIFAQRASTREAKLQVELARRRYEMPRLRNAWSHLSRQRGGVKGTRGEGERQIEVDRRLVEKRINKLEKDIEKVKKQRGVQRQKRILSGQEQLALVGYTNAGKSSLFQRLSGRQAFIKDQVFATLDPNSRTISLPGGRNLTLTDTVGLIRKLPHELVNAFKASLEELRLADLLLIVVDCADPEWEAHLHVTQELIKELGAEHCKYLVVFNKIDLIKDDDELRFIKNRYKDGILSSAHSGAGIDELLDAISQNLNKDMLLVNLHIPVEHGKLFALLQSRATVLNKELSAAGTHLQIQAMIAERELRTFKAFML